MLTLPLLCSWTFIVFFTYWVVIFILKSIGSAIKKFNKQKIPLIIDTSHSLRQTNNQKILEIQDGRDNRLINTPTFSRRVIEQEQIENENNDMSSHSNSDQQNQQIIVEQLENGEKKIAAEEYSLNSQTNELNIAMVQPKNNENQQQKSLNECQLNQVIKQINNNQRVNKLSNLQEKEFQPSSQIVTQPNLKKREEDKSQLQLIQALSIHNVSNESDISYQLEKKEFDVDPTTAILIQQIDELFLNDQQKFMCIIEKYKIKQTRLSKGEAEEKKNIKVIELEQLVKDKEEQMSKMEIQISEYRQLLQEKQIQSKKQKQSILILEQTIKEVTSNDKNAFQSYIKKQQNQNENIQQQCEDKGEKEEQIENDRKQIKQCDEKKECQEAEAPIINQKQSQQKQIQEPLIEGKENASKEEEQNKQIIKNFKEQLIEVQKIKQISINPQEHNNKSPEKSKREKQQKQAIHRYNSLICEPQTKSIKQQTIKMKTQYQQQQVHPHSEKTKSQCLENNCQMTEIEDIKRANVHLKNQIEFAQTQIRMLEESQVQNLKKIQELQKKMEVSNSFINRQVLQLRAKMCRMQPIVNEYGTMHKRYLQIKSKIEKGPHPNDKNKSYPTVQKQTNQSYPLIKTPSRNKSNHYQSSSEYKKSEKEINHEKQNKLPSSSFQFLIDCDFVTLQDREFLHEVIQNLMKGIITTEKLYNSKTNKVKNPHELIDNVPSILVLVELQNGKILGAYTHQAFSSINPQSSNENIAFIFDVSSRRSFTNQSGINSIKYNPTCLTWGFTQLMVSFEQPEVMYSNFCRSHNIYWDGRYKIQEFIGSDKKWARINQYEIFKIMKI